MGNKCKRANNTLADSKDCKIRPSGVNKQMRWSLMRPLLPSLCSHRQQTNWLLCASCCDPISKACKRLWQPFYAPCRFNYKHDRLWTKFVWPITTGWRADTESEIMRSNILDDISTKLSRLNADFSFHFIVRNPDPFPPESNEFGLCRSVIILLQITSLISARNCNCMSWLSN